MSHAPEREDYWAGWEDGEFWVAQDTKGEALREYFAHPKYRRVNGHPVMYRGNADSLLYYDERFGYTPDDVLRAISSGAREEIYWVATNTKPEHYKDLKSWGFNAFTEYLIYPLENTWADAMVTYRNAWERGIEVARSTGLKYWVPTTSGFDSRAWYDHPSRFMPTPEQYEAHVREATEFSRKHFAFTDGQVVHESWSEFGEGSFIEPGAPDSLHPGTVMLDAFQRGANAA